MLLKQETIGVGGGGISITSGSMNTLFFLEFRGKCGGGFIDDDDREVEQLRKMDGTRRGLGWLGDQKERSGSVFLWCF